MEKSSEKESKDQKAGDKEAEREMKKIRKRLPKRKRKEIWTNVLRMTESGSEQQAERKRGGSCFGVLNSLCNLQMTGILSFHYST